MSKQAQKQKFLITAGEFKGQHAFMYFEQECNALVRLEQSGEIVCVEYDYLQEVPGGK